MNQITLITGASSGIGLELAKVFAAKKHDLILVARTESKLVALKTELEEKFKIQAYVIPADLSTADGVAKLVEEVKAKKLDVEILVNNAGLGSYGAFATDGNWSKQKEMLQVNIVALTELCNAFIPAMVERKSGKILNLASTAAFQPGPLMAVYYATKAYVLHFSEAIAEELTGKGVSVTALCPGPTTSGFSDAASMSNSRLFKSKLIPSSQSVAEYAYGALMEGKRVAIHGLVNSILAQTVRFTPRTVVTKIAKKLQEQVS